MFIALRDLWFARGRFLLMASVIALVAMLMVLLTGLANGLAEDNIGAIRQLPSDHLAFSAETGAKFDRSSVSLDQVEAVAATPGVTRAAPLGRTLFLGKVTDGPTVDLVMLGMVPGSFIVPSPSDGQALGSRPDGVLISQGLVDQGVAIGDVITLDRVGTRLTVIGTTGKASQGHVPAVYAPLRLWQEATYGPPGGAPDGTAFPDSVYRTATVVALDTRSGADLGAMDRSVGLVTLTKTEAYGASSGYKEETGTLLMIEGFLYVIAALLVGAFLTVWTIQRRSEIGLIKALGASTAYLLRDALGQAAIVLVSATAVGVAIGLGLGALIGGSVPFALGAGPVLFASGLVVVMGLLGGSIAIRRITSVDPLIALGGAR